MQLRDQLNWDSVRLQGFHHFTEESALYNSYTVRQKMSSIPLLSDFELLGFFLKANFEFYFL